MTEGTRRRAGFWLVGRFTSRQVDWMVLAAAVALSMPQVLKAALGDGGLPVVLAVLPFGTLPLLWRRTRPGLVLLVLVAAFSVPAALGLREPLDPGLLFGAYAAALYGGRPTRLVAGAAAAAALLAVFGIVLATGSTGPLGHVGGPALAFGVAWVLGDRTRIRRAYLAQLEERAARLERERAEHAQRAAEAERIRIARELHDVVVHNVSVIAVHAGAARATFHLDPDRASASVGLIERTARATLTELRTLLGVLRREDRSAPALTPQPSLAQLDRLLDQARAAGVQVDARVRGEARPLPATADLAAYRIVQEALTNVVKHAPGASVVLTLDYRPSDLQIVVADDGPRAPAPGGGSGTPTPGGSGAVGLIGMRERAALLGGELRAGPAPAGGFRVEARLPTGPAAVEAANPAPPPEAQVGAATSPVEPRKRTP